MTRSLGLLVGSQEELLSALLDQSHDCIKLLDAGGHILFLNQEGCRTMELSDPGAVIGQAWIGRWPEECRATVEDAFRSASAGSAARFSAWRTQPGGERRWWDVTVTPIANDGAARFLTIARDVTAEVVEKERVAAINAEMRHRLRNAMTIAAGIVTLEARANVAFQPFARSVCDRFSQLARVQDLVLDPAQEKSLPHILPLLAGVYGDGDLLRIGTLPDARLSDAATQALALTIGELATNSLKYGALRNAAAVQIDASVCDAMLTIVWREPTEFGTPREGSQGLGLIDRLVAAAGGRFVRETIAGALIASVSLPVAR